MSQQPYPDSRAFRQTMGLFATGVTVLATYTSQGEPVGMTANAVTSVSLDPMLVLVCVGKQASIVPHLLAADGFSLNILSARQKSLSVFFARMWKDDSPPPFVFEAWQGGPRLVGCLGAVGCAREAVLEGGDHWIVLGRLLALYQAEDTSDPLIFYGGQYRQLKQKD